MLIIKLMKKWNREEGQRLKRAASCCLIFFSLLFACFFFASHSNDPTSSQDKCLVQMQIKQISKRCLPNSSGTMIPKRPSSFNPVSVSGGMWASLSILAESTGITNRQSVSVILCYCPTPYLSLKLLLYLPRWKTSLPVKQTGWSPPVLHCWSLGRGRLQPAEEMVRTKTTSWWKWLSPWQYRKVFYTRAQ